MKQQIVVVGNVFHGNLTFHGPFEDVEHANQWIAKNASNQPTHVFPLQDH